MFIYAIMCHWMGAISWVSLYVAITHFSLTCMMICYGYEIETELVVGWFEVELMRVFEILCGRCYMRREHGL